MLTDRQFSVLMTFVHAGMQAIGAGAELQHPGTTIELGEAIKALRPAAAEQKAPEETVTP